MKKIIIVLITLFFTTGCYDYVELSDLAIISAVSVDFKDDEYNVGFEIMNTKDKEDNSNEKKVYTAKGKGENISEAFYNASLEVAKIPYFAHLKAVIINEEIAKNKLEEIIDFLLRDNHIRNVFYLVVATDVDAEDILEKTDTNNPVIGSAIKGLIDNTSYMDNIAVDINYQYFVKKIVDPHKDAYISSVTIENDLLKLGPIAIFKGTNMVATLSNKESAMFNLIDKNSKDTYFKISCPEDQNKSIIFDSDMKPKSEIEINEDSAKIKLILNVRILENQCNIDFKSADTYENYQNILNEKISSDIKETVDKLVEKKSDVLGINDKYYKKYRKEIDFTKLNYTYEVESLINRGGLIYEVEYDK